MCNCKKQSCNVCSSAGAKQLYIAVNMKVPPDNFNKEFGTDAQEGDIVIAWDKQSCTCKMYRVTNPCNPCKVLYEPCPGNEFIEGNGIKFVQEVDENGNLICKTKINGYSIIYDAESNTITITDPLGQSVTVDLTTNAKDAHPRLSVKQSEESCCDVAKFDKTNQILTLPKPRQITGGGGETILTFANVDQVDEAESVAPEKYIYKNEGCRPVMLDITIISNLMGIGLPPGHTTIETEFQMSYDGGATWPVTLVNDSVNNPTSGYSVKALSQKHSMFTNTLQPGDEINLSFRIFMNTAGEGGMEIYTPASGVVRGRTIITGEPATDGCTECGNGTEIDCSDYTEPTEN